MTFANLKDNLQTANETFKRISVDDQLALLWYAYTEMGGAITPAAPGAASPAISGGLVEQFKALSHMDQLDEMRKIATGSDTRLSREYGSLSANTKLAFWYQLAQGMEDGSIVPMPEDYNFGREPRDLLAALETIDFEQQITFLRNAVVEMGAQPKAGAAI